MFDDGPIGGGEAARQIEICLGAASNVDSPRCIVRGGLPVSPRRCDETKDWENLQGLHARWRRHAFSVIRLTVISDEGEGWYRVKTGTEEFFLNLNHATRLYED